MKVAVLILSVIFPILSVAQGFGSNPPGIDWKTINTEHYEIIFPAEIEKDAQRVANTLESTYLAVNKSLKTKSPKISLLLNNHGIIPNGYVRLGPRMSEWFAAPPQNSSLSPLLGTGEWFNVLASHEMRHVAQYEAMNKGFTYFMYLFMGDVGRALMQVLSMPTWVLEGDAVGTETALSNSGRGRLPSYDMEIRALLLSDKRYSYYKAWLGSYDDHYPDVYHLGYLLTSHIKRTYGVQKLADAIARTGKISIWPFAFTSSLNGKTKKGASAMYEETMDELTNLWKKQLEGLKFTDAKIINKRECDDWSSYAYPQYGSDGNIYSIKSSKGIPSTLVKVSPNGEEGCIEQVSLIFPVFKVTGNNIAWNDIGWNLRWSSRNYSEILTHDISKDKTNRITSYSRLLSPVSSPDGKAIAAVEFDELRNTRLVLIDAVNGNKIKEFYNADNYFISSPSWSEDGTKIVFTRQKTKGKALSVLDIKQGTSIDIISEGWENISDPVFFKDYILYNSPYSGIDNIYAVNSTTGKRFQVTSRKFGAFNPCVSKDGKKMLFNDYSVEGYNIAEMALDPEKWLPIESVEDRSIKYYESLIAQEQGKNIFDEKEIPKELYPVEKYHPILNIFNIHSWMLNPNTVQPGVQVVSSDVLGTTQIGAGIDYNFNEKVFGGVASVSYGGIYPIITAGAGYGARYTVSGDLENSRISESWTETSLNGGISLPFDLSKGIYSRGLEIGAKAELIRVDGRIDPNDDKLVTPFQYYLQFYNSRHASERDIKPVWGQKLFVSFINTPLISKNHTTQGSANLDLYFPGIFRHHSLQIQTNYEWQEPNGYTLGSYFLFPRGYDAIFHKNLYKLSADYTFPIFYPDLALGQWFYFKRFKANFFFDYGEGRNKDFVHQTKYKSLGGELTVDFHLFAWPFLIDLGVRYSYMPDEKINKKDKIEAIFNFGI